MRSRWGRESPHTHTHTCHITIQQAASFSLKTFLSGHLQIINSCFAHDHTPHMFSCWQNMVLEIIWVTHSQTVWCVVLVCPSLWEKWLQESLLQSSELCSLNGSSTSLTFELSRWVSSQSLHTYTQLPLGVHGCFPALWWTGDLSRVYTDSWQLRWASAPSWPWIGFKWI